jgi:sigma-B regulation protein RsbU (phosphoserine phosphatase)
MVVTDLLEGDLAAVHTGTIALGIRHVLCAPLRVVRYVERKGDREQRQNIGVLYLDSREKGRLLSVGARVALEALASEAALAIENARLYQEVLEKSRVDQELRTASQIQQALLPEGRREGAFFQAFAASIPSRAIGGDFFDYQDLPDGRLRFGLGDVTGKGPPAALLTALVQGVLAASSLDGATPDAVASLLNRVLLSRRIDARFLTLFLGVLSAEGTLLYCNAAQNPPLLFSGGNWRRLETGGTLLGAFPEARYQLGTETLRPGDTILLFSDGISEAMTAAGEEFGEERVSAVVQAALAGEPRAILDALFDAVRSFVADEGQSDDLTALVLRYTGIGG